jgi:low affinity Fe/Cu permease
LNDRTVYVVGALVALVITAVVVVFLASPPTRDVTPVLAMIIGIPVAVFSGLNFLQGRSNARALNGQMDKHLENATQLGVDAAKQTAEQLAPEVRKAIRDGTKDAVNELLKTQRSAAAAARKGHH